ncbi:MAG TPA: helix-turn-helix domain-containing protein [Chthoniobacteraceae bacterium]|jgi:AraC family transcriptional regulator of arabinose operon
MPNPSWTPPPPPYAWVLTGYFDRKQEYRVVRGAGTNDWLLFFTLSGAGRLRFAGTDLVVRRGDVALYAPGTPQDYGLLESGARWEFLWAHFQARPDWAELLKWPLVAPGLSRLQIPERAIWSRLREALRSAHRFASTSRRHAKIRAMHALEGFFLECASAAPAASDSRLDSRIEKSLEFIQRHLRQPLSRAVLAEQAGLSLHRFAHLFQEQVGKSPRQFIEDERIKIARHLLETTSAPLSRIALETGFPNLFYFSQRFKTSSGSSPSAFRARLRKGEVAE